MHVCQKPTKNTAREEKQSSEHELTIFYLFLIFILFVVFLLYLLFGLKCVLRVAGHMIECAQELHMMLPNLSLPL